MELVQKKCHTEIDLELMLVTEKYPFSNKSCGELFSPNLLAWIKDIE